jgi:hypothetical protein
MLAEALTFYLASFASHCFRCLCLVLHGSIIQLTLAVCQAQMRVRVPLFSVCFQGDAWVE